MILQGVVIKIVILCFLVIFIGGCAATGPQFIPEELENRQVSELVELYINGRTKNVYIDGERVRSRVVYLAPGTHSLKFNIYEETKSWKDLVKSMERKGFSLSENGNTFVRTQDGSTTETAPLGVSPYGWNSKRIKEVSLDGGTRYWLTNLE